MYKIRSNIQTIRYGEESYSKTIFYELFKMWDCRLVHGNRIYIYGIHRIRRYASDGENLPFDVSDLWDGSIVGACLPRYRWLVGDADQLCLRDKFWRHGMNDMVLIFLAEYVSGAFLKRHGICPWDYSGRLLNIDGLIRLDFAPCWFGAGLLFERLTLGK